MTDELKALNQERYARAAENYVVSTVHASGMGIETLVDMVKPQSDWHMLDVATGGGHTALLFAPHVAQVVASDFTPRMLQAAQGFITEQGIKNMSFSGADAEILPFASQSFDLVTCRVAAHHFPNIFAFMREAVRVLKPNGTLLIHDHVVSDDEKVADYVNAYEKLRDPAHARALPEYEWRGVFLDVGLTIQHVEQRTVKHDVLPWAKRQNCSDETIERLQVMLLRAPEKVRQWMQPEFAGTEHARYTDHHIFIVGQRG
ncbi:MAG: class I SAM-dependent methyltransferase [Anaerolineae bacterium]|nr:class I SAM-dependent methyltransferase [Anaerolineae bacterium]